MVITLVQLALVFFNSKCSLGILALGASGNYRSVSKGLYPLMRHQLGLK